MIINYQFIKTKSSTTNQGICYIFNENLKILVRCHFIMTLMDIGVDKKRPSIMFPSSAWERTSFDDTKQHLIKYLQNEPDDKIIMLCTYNDNIHPDLLEKGIKTDISLRIKEFLMIKK